ncbi:MotA/TolQ/ExbB proton channel family protein [Parendozoicomonas haliclonae]|uniref:Biopolymer transport protein ExbB n=1 Tax=Parendozoicomonas haliclonae TaxID=1960125 RepID=A0A1X7APB0_9GAMM|nr:MotA/TolQ/ExbB proton channel family protein [Parendozoicomonas haliclonae]SMA49930.1 biopolymer transport protein ExbB [Parendozoicomonas haliclonae]
MKTIIKAALFVLAGAISGTAFSEQALSLDELLKQVEKGQVAEARDNRVRERRFLAEQTSQQQKLTDARNTLNQKEQQAAQLEKLFEENERLLTSKQSQLKERMGNLTELFGHLISASGDLRGVIDNSLTSVQYPDRTAFLDQLIEKMSGAEQLPQMQEIERLWFELQREMTESGKVVSFTAPVTSPAGETSEQTVVRVGSFNAITADGHYLTYDNGSLAQLARQPASEYLQWGQTLSTSSTGLTPFGIDPTGPSGGSFLSALIDSPSLVERWHQGGVIGYIISGLGVFAVLFAVLKLLTLAVVNAKVKSQLRSNKANNNNPLGRVLAVHEQDPNMDSETLELKLSEAIIRETPKLEHGLNLLKIIAAVAPLMGLLGTVTGMIITFQAITIFGAGDPKAMAGGISGALVTTVLGLIVAIPTILLHTLVNGKARGLINILVEQSTGIIAQHTEATQATQNSAQPASANTAASRPEPVTA